MYATDQDSFVVQGWKIFANDLLMQLDVPDGHVAVEVPTELFEHLTKDGLPSGTIKNFSAPIMIRTKQGTCVVQGPKMRDPEALSQMRLPDYEDCIELPRTAILNLLEDKSGPDHQRSA
ncbi:hypothetical protein ACFY2H_00840 [Streptomyces griseofuscus]|uniref:hypothetical protein n=1 Tax=Streptomyces griseofuscus TaxID=146922 RepID=UPI0036CE1ADD